MKLFVTSDIHSFFTIFHNELKSKGFEENNPNHLLIVLGDVFDRGEEAVEVYNYLNNLSNVILVRGNHEDLLMQMLDRDDCLYHDVVNGTADTAGQLYKLVNGKASGLENKMKTVKELITPFINKFINYFETNNYIFVHGWIPCYNIYKSRISSKYMYKSDWRESTDDEWYNSRWISPIDAYTSKVIEPNKTIVCGHWHTSAAHSKLHNNGSEWYDDACFDPFYDKGIIMLDACTVRSHKCNVIVLEDDLLNVDVN